MNNEKKSDWASYGMMEAPYWRNGMSPEEYEFERAYFINISKGGLKSLIKYRPLWSQNKKVQCDLSDAMKVIELADKIKYMNDEKLKEILIDV